MSENAVTLSGNLTRDPELKFTQSGAAVCRFGIAANHRWFNKAANDWEEKPMFFDVIAWSDLAENIAETLAKGNRAIVTGRLDFQQWETEDGQKRNKVEVVASDVGPSLRWDTAEVVRSERTGGGGGRKKASTRKSAPSSYEDDEEPF